MTSIIYYNDEDPVAKMERLQGQLVCWVCDETIDPADDAVFTNDVVDPRAMRTTRASRLPRTPRSAGCVMRGNRSTGA